MDGPTLLQVHQKIPDTTDILVFNANGELEPLVTQEAADIIAQGDPIWCPEGTKPGDVGCTASYQSMADLLTFEGTFINSQTVNGTIWISNGSQSLETGPITIDGSIYTNWANYSLTLQGGWNGTTIGMNSVFNVPIYIINWNANVTINHITVVMRQDQAWVSPPTVAMLPLMKAVFATIQPALQFSPGEMARIFPPMEGMSQ
jgi:hypothetical protein